MIKKIKKKIELENQRIKEWEVKFDQELKLKEEKEAFKLEQLKIKEKETPKINKWLDKFNERLKLEKKEETLKFDKIKPNELEDQKIKEKLISKLEDFEIDHNKKN